MMRWAGHVACMREMINASKFLVEKPEEKRPPSERSKHIRDDNIELHLKRTSIRC
jgi:hypothetical protein